MKGLILIAASIILLLASCEHGSTDQEPEPDQDANPINRPDPEVFFKIGSALNYKYSDLELYDSSAHILYFKTNHSEFDKNSSSAYIRHNS